MVRTKGADHPHPSSPVTVSSPKQKNQKWAFTKHKSQKHILMATYRHHFDISSVCRLFDIFTQPLPNICLRGLRRSSQLLPKARNIYRKGGLEVQLIWQKKLWQMVSLFFSIFGCFTAYVFLYNDWFIWLNWFLRLVGLKDPLEVQVEDKRCSAIWRTPVQNISEHKNWTGSFGLIGFSVSFSKLYVRNQKPLLLLLPTFITKLYTRGD